MRLSVESFRQGLALAFAALILTGALATPVQAAPGYWRFTGYATTPPQSQLDESDRATRAMSRTSERKVTGAFQPAGSGAGTLDLYFKTDDIDRRVFLTTLRFSFTTGVEMRALTPGQKIRFQGVMTMGGNALSKAQPASGSGKMAVGNGDYFLSADGGAIGRTVNGQGDMIVPNGQQPGETMQIYAAGYIASLGGLGGHLEMNYVWVAGPAPRLAPDGGAQSNNGGWSADRGGGQTTQAADAIGSRLDVDELDGLWTGVWIRRPGTNIFDADWRSAQYPPVHDVVRLARVSGNQVTFTRDGNGGTYTGTISPDGRTIRGTASWYTGDMRWTARIGGGSAGGSSAGGGFSGAWSTSEGAMTLGQSGGHVSGTYSQDNGRIDGQVAGGRLTGYWGEDGSAQQCPTQRLGTYFWGRIDWVLGADGRHFSGKWSYCDAAPTASWTGDRAASTSQPSGPGDAGPGYGDQAAAPTYGGAEDHGQTGAPGPGRDDSQGADVFGSNEGANTERTLIDIGNPAACGVTDTSTLDLDRPAHLTRVDIWFHWNPGENSVGYTVTSAGQQVGGGTLQRAECDPYQGAWCVARDTPDADLAPGRYEFRTDRVGVCQNSESGGAGFIKAFGYDQ